MKRPSPAFVISMLALLVAIGGTSYAAYSINGKDIKKRTIAGSKLKKNTIKGSEVNEAKLGKVPSAKRADSADRADVASNAEKLGGKGAGDFVDSSRFARAFTTGDRVGTATPTSTPVFERGPFKVTLRCQGAVGAGSVDLAAAYLTIEISEASHSPTGPSSTDKLLPAGSSFDTAKTGLGSSDPDKLKMTTVGAYVDTISGKSMDISARLRVGSMGTPWCSAITQATFGGL